MGELESEEAFIRLHSFLEKNKGTPTKKESLRLQLEEFMSKADVGIARRELGEIVINNWKKVNETIKIDKRDYLKFTYKNWMGQPLILNVEFYAGNPQDCLNSDEKSILADDINSEGRITHFFDLLFNDAKRERISKSKNHLGRCGVCSGDVYGTISGWHN